MGEYWRRRFEVEPRVYQACPLQRIREMASHPRLPDELGVEVQLESVADVLQNVVFDSCVELLLVGDETRTV